MEDIMIDFRLKTFLTLCKVLNYTKTAEILHITQPAVSQHIKYLEDNYNVKLFHYAGKSLELTEAGKILYNFTLAMQASSDRLRLMLTTPKINNYPITFGSTLTIGEYTMSNLLIKLISDFPHINVTMEVGNTKILLEKLRDGKIDFAILEGHFDKSEYNSMFFSTEPFIGVCSPNHPFASKNISFQDIFEERLILREKGSGTRDIFEQILYEHNITMKNFKKITQIGNMSMIKELVIENLGITFLYKEAVKRELSDGSLIKIDLKDFDVEREFNFVFLKDSLHHKEYLDWFNYFISIR
jgi:DNA-binding transcriptional LysR family regulator